MDSLEMKAKYSNTPSPRKTKSKNDWKDRYHHHIVSRRRHSKKQDPSAKCTNSDRRVSKPVYCNTGNI